MWYGKKISDCVSLGLAKHKENATTVHGLSETAAEAEYCTKFGYSFSQEKILTSRRNVQNIYKERLKILIY